MLAIHRERKALSLRSYVTTSIASSSTTHKPAQQMKNVRLHRWRSFDIGVFLACFAAIPAVI